MQTFRNISFTMIVYWRVARWRAVYIWISSIVTGFDGIAYGYVFKLLLDKLVAIFAGQSVPNSDILVLVLSYGGVLLFFNLVLQLRGYYTNSLYSAYSYELDMMLVKKLAVLDVGMFEEHEFQDKLDKVKERSIGYFDTYITELNTLLADVTTIISSLAIFILSPILGLITIVIVLPSFYLQRSVSRFRLKSYEQRRPQARKRSYFQNLLTAVHNIPEIRISNADRFFVPRLSQLQRLFTSIRVQEERTAVKYGLPLTLLDVIGTVFVVYYLALQIANKLLTVGDFQFMWGRFNDTRSAFRGITRSLERVRNADDYVKDFHEIMKIQPTILRDQGVELTGNEITIEFENVSFKYPGSDKFVIKNASFKIADGEKIAFVGQNGAGKTTMIRLLCRFYDPTEGRILINGIDLKELNLNSWYEHTGALFQDFNRYDLMVKENIGIADPSGIEDQGRVQQAAEKSGAAEFIAELDGKYDQMIGKAYEKGTELSGGQWQKIALARAYMRNPEVLILDEPTAAIDAKAEAEIFRKLQDLGQDKTLILISHRFSTVRQVDKIFVIEHGEIVEQGSHADLMQIKDGKYAEMYTLQAQMYQ